MLFSEVFHVDKQKLKDYGAIDISLACDTPLFIDPLLIYLNKDETIKSHYQDIVNYLLFLNKKCEKNYVSEKDIKYYFAFKEKRQNWLGLARIGNKGLALGMDFARKFKNAISFICESNNISNTIHLEKIGFVDHNVGKDKISDMVTNMIFPFLIKYTEKFAKENIDPKYLKKFPIPHAKFDYDLGMFVDMEAVLPSLEVIGKNDFVILTPASILRSGEPSINYVNMTESFEEVMGSISNEDLKMQVNTLIKRIFKDYYVAKSEKMETITTSDVMNCKKKTMETLINRFPELYDYFIRLAENNDGSVIMEAKNEVYYVNKSTLENPLIFSDIFNYRLKNESEFSDAKAESLYRIASLKDNIENGDLWRNLYINDVPIAHEKDIQRLFALTWVMTKYKMDKEPNNGAGPADFVVSFGHKNQVVIEFKLSKNMKENNVYDQVKRYAKDHHTENIIVAIFAFNDDEKTKALRVKRNNEDKNISVVMIDCDRSNKKSASK